MKHNSKPIIAFTINSLGRGGAETCTVKDACFFKSKGYEVIVIECKRNANKDSDLQDKLKQSQIKCIEVSANSFTAKSMHKNFWKNVLRNAFISNVLSSLKLYKEMESKGVNVVIATLNNTVIKTTFAKFLGFKGHVVLREAEEYKQKSALTKLLIKLCYSRANIVILPSQAIYEQVQRCLPKNKIKSIILRNATSAKRKIPKKHQIVHQGVKILSVGRLDENKNQILLLRAIYLIKKLHPDFKFSANIVGEGINHKQLKEFIDNHNLTEELK